MCRSWASPSVNGLVNSPNTIRKIPVTKKSAPIVARAVIEVEVTFFIGRSGLILPKIRENGRARSPHRTRFFVQKLQALKRFFRERFGLIQSGLLVIGSTNADRDECISL